MKYKLKLITMGALSAAGLASAAVAQQHNSQSPNMSPKQHQQMMSGRMQNGHMMAMMADPEMRKQMTAMMEGCNRMMQQMGNMPATDMRPKS